MNLSPKEELVVKLDLLGASILDKQQKLRESGNVLEAYETLGDIRDEILNLREDAEKLK